MSAPTKFQEKCEGELNSALKPLGRELLDRKFVVGSSKVFAGQVETFVTGKVSGTDIQVWIYNNEAQFAGNQLDKRFEAPDYSSEDKLIQAFVEEMKTQLDPKVGIT